MTNSEGKNNVGALWENQDKSTASQADFIGELFIDKEYYQLTAFKPKQDGLRMPHLNIYVQNLQTNKKQLLDKIYN